MTGIVSAIKKIKPDLYLIAFKLEDGSAKTYTKPWLGNFRRWFPVIESGVGTVVSGLIRIKKGMINGDSEIKIEKKIDDLTKF